MKIIMRHKKIVITVYHFTYLLQYSMTITNIFIWHAFNTTPVLKLSGKNCTQVFVLAQLIAMWWKVVFNIVGISLVTCMKLAPIKYKTLYILYEITLVNCSTFGFIGRWFHGLLNKKGDRTTSHSLFEVYFRITVLCYFVSRFESTVEIIYTISAEPDRLNPRLEFRKNGVFNSIESTVVLLEQSKTGLPDTTSPKYTCVSETAYLKVICFKTHISSDRQKTYNTYFSSI